MKRISFTGLRWTLILLLPIAFGGCSEPKKKSIITIGVFDSIDPQKLPPPAEFIALKSYTNTLYNPSEYPTTISENELEKLGYVRRMHANTELLETQQRLFSQGIANSKGQAVIAETEPLDQETYKLTVNFRSGAELPKDSTKQTAVIGAIGTGSLKLENGLIVTWSTKQKRD